MTQIITYFQTREHEKLIITFFTRCFPSPSVCHKNLRFCWKLLRTIIYSLELEKLTITFFQEKMKKCEFLPIDISKNISIYADISYTYIPIQIYRYIERNILIFSLYRYIVAIPRYTKSLGSCAVRKKQKHPLEDGIIDRGSEKDRREGKGELRGESRKCWNFCVRTESKGSFEGANARCSSGGKIEWSGHYHSIIKRRGQFWQLNLHIFFKNRLNLCIYNVYLIHDNNNLALMKILIINYGKEVITLLIE